MTLLRLCLLAGLVLVPIWILWYGHHLRDRGTLERGVFWGAVAGHAAGILVTAAAALLPPVLWSDAARTAAVHLALVGWTLVGIAVGVGVAARMRGKT